MTKNAASQDYHAKYGPTSASGPQVAIDQRAGVPFTTNTNNTVVALKTCDGFFFLAAAIIRG